MTSPDLGPADPHRALERVWPPFMGVRPHLADTQGRWFAWITEPPGVYDITAPGLRVTDEYATFLEGPVTALLNQVHGTTQRVRFMHDWRFIPSYTLTIRARLVAWGLSAFGRTRVETITALLEPDAPLMVRMACSVGAAMMAAGGVKDARARSG